MASHDRSDPTDSKPLPHAFSAPLREHLTALRAEVGLARNSIAAYRRDLTAFLAYAVRRGARAVQDIDHELLVDYLASLRGPAARAESSVARALAAVRGFVQFLVAEGVLTHDPSARLRAPRLERRLPDVPSIESVEHLLTSIKGSEPRELRDRALLEVLYATGARISEACGLTTDGLPPGLRELRLVGKGNKTRLVPLGERGAEALLDWMEYGRPKIKGAIGLREVFVSLRAAPLTRQAAWRIVKRRALAAGLPASLKPHTLRHAFASHLVESGADLRSVQEMLGHASIKTTELYTHLDGERVLALHRLHHPRG